MSSESSQPVSITRELIRRRAEHNDGEIFSLEEIALHQQSIGKIQHIDVWCPKLKILYLQANEISKIENVRRLKELEYLNLALNKIELVENLEGCESLEKLDLTVNCISRLSSLASLAHNCALRELYLTGNPCTKYENYRLYVIGTLPQLAWLDGVEVLHTERISARADYDRISLAIAEQESRAAHDSSFVPIERAPEIRRQLRGERNQSADLQADSSKSEDIPLATRDGRVLNANRAGVKFTLNEEDEAVVLTVKIPKLMDTSLLDVDVQPTFVRLLIKGELLQLVLPAEVKSDQAEAQRSLASGNLVVTMPKVDAILKPKNKTTSRGGENDDIPPLELIPT